MSSLLDYYQILRVSVKMDNFNEISKVIGRASLASVKKPDGLVDRFSKDPHKPKDSFYLVHVLSLFFGLLNMLPAAFFVTANDYWMYKFRDPAIGVDLNNKTTLQKYFTSGVMVVQTVPSVIFMLMSTYFGHRLKMNSRTVGSLVLISTIFIVFTICIKVNTDTWQVGFFVATLLGLSTVTAINNLFHVTTMAILAKFPTSYMKSSLLGQGMATIFSAVLQMTSLALSSSTITSALFYFVSGTCVIVFSLVLYLVTTRTAFYQYYMQIELEDTKKKHTKEQIKTTFFKTWPSSAILVIIVLTMNVSHPSITSLIVSENYGNGNRWNDVYFIPGILFFFGEICSQFGRLLAKPIITKTNSVWIISGVVLRMVILVPLVFFCNAQPRNNLPVLLPHDYQFILICMAYFFTSGYILNIAYLSIHTLAEGQDDLAYMIMLSALALAGLSSPVSLLAVRLL